MARRYYKKRRKTKQQKELEERLRWGLEPETQRSILGVILVVIGLVFTLSVFGIGGAIGNYLAFFLKFLFGIIGFPIPVIVFIIGTLILAPTTIEFRLSGFLGTGLALICLSSLAHLFVNPDVAFEVAKAGAGGGIIGFGLASVFNYVFGFWGSLIILLGGFTVSLLVAFNYSLRGFFERVKIWREEQTDSDDKKPKKRFTGFSFFGRRKKIKQPKAEPAATEQPIASDADWNFPPLSLLDDNDTSPKAGNIQKNSRIMEETLANFGIDVKVNEVNIGPTVSQYAIKPETGVKLNQITSRQNDLSLALAAHPIRIEAPIPGRSAVGIEVPNKVPAIVKLKKIISSDKFKKKKGHLPVVLGRDVSGDARLDDLEDMPHLLIAGSTGSGKSVCINAILTTFLYKNSPRDLRLILIDPKRVEFADYNEIPHLLSPVITNHKEAVSSLKWAISEMERRYDLFQEARKRNLATFNQSASKEERLPIIVIVIDELADLMAVSAREIEGAIVRLTQMARATGIHMIVATQRPSVDVITGLIKANITNRIAFAVASQVDSRVVLDQSGAEKLLGNGDMLYLSKDSAKPIRIQGILMADNEITKLTKFLAKQAEVKYNDEITQFKGKINGLASTFAGRETESQDELLEEAAKMVVLQQKGSASLLQRTLSVGYARAARILDELQAMNIVGQAQDSKPREVMIPNEEALEELFAAKDPSSKPKRDDR